MHLFMTFAAAAAFLGCSRAFPLLEEARSIEPCQKVRENVDVWILENGVVPRNLTLVEELLMVGTVPPVPIRPSLAYACLRSVPLDKKTALEYLDVLRPFVEWQSTVDYLRDPPKGYLSEGVDLVRGLDEIQTKLERKDYKNEFDFLADLHTLLHVRVRDYHFAQIPLLMDLFTLELGSEFISISPDGVSKPEIFLYGDLQHENNGYSPSPVSAIDGVSAHKFLHKVSVYDGWSHDPDARLNRLFPSVANSASPFSLKASPFALDLPDKTTVKLRNGTKLEFTNTAWFRANFTNVSSGSDLFQQYGLGNGTGPNPSPSLFERWRSMNFTTSFEGYPAPLYQSSCVGGFLLNDDKALSDVAVLSVNSFTEVFSPYDPNFLSMGYEPLVFYNAVAGLLQEAKELNKSKLILDLQGNQGGSISTLLSLYLSLFPNKHKIFPGLYQMRAHPQAEWFGEETYNASEPTMLPFAFGDKKFVKPGSNGVNSNWTLWESFAEFYNPIKGFKGQGKYTRPSLIRPDTYLQAGIFDFKAPFDQPPFRPEDIIIITDGLCGSACAIFTDALVNVHGVKTVALGGRALEAPMQAIGFTKGGPLYGLDLLTAPHGSAVDRSNVPDGLQIPPPIDSTLPLRILSAQGHRASWASGMTINLANAIPWDSPDDGEGALPYQMMYEAANCKLFYTWDMSREIVNVWKAAASVAWNGGKCVKGSTTTEDGRIGGVPKYSSKVDDKYSLGPGPGALRK
ncbi:hypothetical protein V8F33_005091 [Rhypophila sp. PSN 637]